jgi:hypothetical protein
VRFHEEIPLRTLIHDEVSDLMCQAEALSNTREQRVEFYDQPSFLFDKPCISIEEALPNLIYAVEF